jgi:cytidylate kinase
VVFPDADCKFFVTASVPERARRRQAEQAPEVAPGDLSATQAEIEARDRRDRERAHSPLVQAVDATVIDTDTLTPDAVVTRMLEVVQARARP